MRTFAPAGALLISVFLSACGGSSNSSVNSPPATKLLAGTTASTGSSIFPYSRNQYTITQTAGGYAIADNVRGGVKYTSGTDTINFADVAVNLKIVDQSRTLPGADLKSLIELYVAFFNRVPDADGLSYWIGQLKSGATLSSIADTFYQAGVANSATTGYSATMTDAAFITKVYKNVLGRDSVEADALPYWTGQIGLVGRGAVVLAILNVAHTYKGDANFGWVADLLDRKYAVGYTFAVQQGLNYLTTADSLTKTMAIAAAITPTDSAKALNLIGTSAAAYLPNPAQELQHMRAAHMSGNYGSNISALQSSRLLQPQAITADSATVDISRNVFVDPSGKSQTFEFVSVKLAKPVLDGKNGLPQVGFWISKNVQTNDVSLTFNVSNDTSLAGIAGFAGDVSINVAGDGSFVDVSQVHRLSGNAKDFVSAIIANGANLIKNATVTKAANSSFDLTATMKAINTVKDGVYGLDNSFFNYLRGINADWIALNVTVFYGDLSTPQMSIQYRPPGNTDSGAPFTMDDADLEYFLTRARAEGFKIKLGLEFGAGAALPVSKDDPLCLGPKYKVNRWLLGQPNVSSNDPFHACTNPNYWWWSPSHPDHAKNVALFFQSFTDIAVKYAKIAQKTGVEMYCPATEQDNLFRTRSAAAPYTNNFKNELAAVVAAIRAEYAGMLTYDQQHIAFSNPNFYAGGAGTAAAFEHVFEDLGLDVVGTSAYFNMVDSNPNRVMSVAELEVIWENIFSKFLIPRKLANPGKPMIFTEFGYTDDVSAASLQAANLGVVEPAGASAANPSPGMQQQANIFQAFFNVNAKHNDIVQGAFLWGIDVPDNYQCARISFSTYCKSSEQNIKNVYANWKAQDANGARPGVVK